jgi:hypothetical protein
MEPLRGLYLARKKLGVALLRKDFGGPPQPKRCPPSFHGAFDGANEANTVLGIKKGCHCKRHVWKGAQSSDREGRSRQPCIRVLSRFLLSRFGHDGRLRLEDFNEELQLIRLC